MKHLLYGVLLVCVAMNNAVALDPVASVTNSQPDVSFTAGLSTASAEATEPIALSAVVQNRSTNEVRIALMEKYLDCTVIVRNERGETIPPTRYNQALSKMARRSGTYVRTLRPGESYTYSIPVNLLYDMSVPEKYFVSALVNVYFDRGGEKASIELRSAEQQVLVRRAIGSRE